MRARDPVEILDRAHTITGTIAGIVSSVVHVKLL
jgi:L-rhamnose isomerase